VVWGPVVTTVLLEWVGLGLSAILALVGWPFGWLPDPGLVALMTTLVALGPTAELYRAGARPRRAAVIAALLALMTGTVLVAAAVTWAVPSLTAPRGAALAVGHLVALPAGGGGAGRVPRQGGEGLNAGPT
jgi:spore maturation protein SpmB